MPDLKVQVQGFRVWCEGGMCKVTITTETGDVDMEATRDQVGPMVHSMLQNGVTLSYSEEELEVDPYRLQNLKAELAAAEANLKHKQDIAGTGYVEGEGFGQSMQEHHAGIQSIFLDMYVERLKREIKEIEESD